MTKVSVIIPCFNAEDFVAEAIDSALGQTIADVEVIVVDDASTDGSRAIISAKAAQDSRVVPVFLERNVGPAAARNIAWTKLTGTWVTLLDADDLYLPDRLERLVSFAEAQNADVVADNLSIRHFGDDTHLAAAFPHVANGEIIRVDRAFFFKNLWNGPQKYGMGILKPMFRAKFVRENSIAYDERYRIGEDMLFYMNSILSNAKYYILGDCFYIYRKRADSISNVGDHVFTTLASMCEEILSNDKRLTTEDREHLTKRGQGLLEYFHWRQLRALRRRGDKLGFISYVIKRPSSLFYMMKMSVAWRMKRG
ncbi:glycosyltransferase family 2 protein [Rhizobium sp. WYCCWR 11279]|uniref:glycosyltransferase family 2 protein n=1 Tax=Rhizobium changzhiense TaxID=2692317 RepID=UPI001490AD90|nr:glycosyltransferase family 2 protein [Rhizobium changzhiense]MCH4545376.1 glycosyltransferase family 2 protein [Rhizobium changzhiense]NNU49922.1 glycosyltransferase family 2 protein [Rhizobium changzhiense]